MSILRAPIVQNAYLVPDLEAACVRLNRLYGIGPFLGGTRELTMDDHVYRGVPADPIRLSNVFVQAGAVVFELIQLRSEAPSAFHDMIADDRPVFHHVAVWATDYEQDRDAAIAAGYPVASEFTIWGDVRICYLDTRAAIGHMTELYPEHPGVRAMYERTRREAAEWDGRALIRPW